VHSTDREEKGAKQRARGGGREREGRSTWCRTQAAAARITVAMPQVDAGGAVARGLLEELAGAGEANGVDPGGEAGESREGMAGEEDGSVGGASAMRNCINFPLMTSICHRHT